MSGAARLSWERARRIADTLPADDPDQLSMRIAPRTMLLCATDYQDRAFQESRGRFAELRELCSAAGDKVSLAIAMSGPVSELLYAGRTREGRGGSSDDKPAKKAPAKKAAAKPSAKKAPAKKAAKKSPTKKATKK